MARTHTNKHTHKHKHAHAQEKYLSWVEDRAFNDLRYTVNSEALKQLGWKEEVRLAWFGSELNSASSFTIATPFPACTHPGGVEDGLRMTVEWYKEHTGRYPNIDTALVPHPTSIRASASCVGESEQGL